jgi:hypothetical protein
MNGSSPRIVFAGRKAIKDGAADRDESCWRFCDCLRILAVTLPLMIIVTLAIK